MSVTQPTEPLAAARPSTRARDVLTVIMLVGAAFVLFLPFGLFWATVIWVVGAALLWSSPSWSTRDKMLGSLVWPGGLIGPMFALTSAGQVCTTLGAVDAGAPGQVAEPICTGFAFSPWVGVPLALILLAAPLVVGAILLERSSRT